MKINKTLFVLAFVLAVATVVRGQPPDSSTLKNDLQKYLTVLNAKRSFSGEILVAR